MKLKHLFILFALTSVTSSCCTWVRRCIPDQPTKPVEAKEYKIVSISQTDYSQYPLKNIGYKTNLYSEIGIQNSMKGSNLSVQNYNLIGHEDITLNELIDSVSIIETEKFYYPHERIYSLSRNNKFSATISHAESHSFIETHVIFNNMGFITKLHQQQKMGFPYSNSVSTIYEMDFLNRPTKVSSKHYHYNTGQAKSYERSITYGLDNTIKIYYGSSISSYKVDTINENISVKLTSEGPYRNSYVTYNKNNNTIQESGSTDMEGNLSHKNTFFYNNKANLKRVERIDAHGNKMVVMYENFYENDLLIKTEVFYEDKKVSLIEYSYEY